MFFSKIESIFRNYVESTVERVPESLAEYKSLFNSVQMNDRVSVFYSSDKKTYFDDCKEL
jgi:hypothetical protein